MPTSAITSGDAARRRLQVWREQQADQLDPARFQLMDALARRALAYQGTARQRLEARLTTLVDAYAEALTQAHVNDTHTKAEANAPHTGPLHALVEYAAALTASEDETRARFPELAALDDFKDLWASLHMRQQVRQALTPATTDAGPLNSGRLVHHALTLMRTLSPGYLQQFFSYIDLLAWMEPLTDATRPAAQTPASRKRTRTSRTK